MKAISSLVNVDSIDNDKNLGGGFSAESHSLQIRGGAQATFPLKGRGLVVACPLSDAELKWILSHCCSYACFRPLMSIFFI